MASADRTAHFRVFKQQGLTLIEVMVAMSILAWILIIAQVVIQTAGRAGQISEERSQQLKDLDRVWVLLETDLRNAVYRDYQSELGGAFPAMIVAQSDDYILSFIRAGLANPLLLPRSEVIRVGYRVEDEALWRDSWVDPFNPSEDTARAQQLLDGVEGFEVMALPPAPTGRSISEGPWLDQWPSANLDVESLPLALEIKLILPNERELRRVITLAPGA